MYQKCLFSGNIYKMYWAYFCQSKTKRNKYQKSVKI